MRRRPWSDMIATRDILEDPGLAERDELGSHMGMTSLDSRKL